jgi:hypothetical protein
MAGPVKQTGEIGGTFCARRGMATGLAIDFTYRYPFASEVTPTPSGLGLRLATCGANLEHPCFFDGRMREPRVVAGMLLVLADVVRTHFFLPRPANLDPVVTSSEAMIRFEGFSGCCGVYARVDLPAAAFDREIQGRGTTNVDFNDPMRAALGRIREREEVRLSVGGEGVTLRRGEESVVEKRVKLPVRWIKGFSEVQAYQPSLELKTEVHASEARRFLRSLPSGIGPKRTCYVAQAGRSLRLTARTAPGAVPLSGTNRIRVLEPLLGAARSLRIWANDGAGTSGWEVLFAAGRFFLMLSPELYRGFSGEGQVLERLAGRRWEEALPVVRDRLSWQAEIDGQAIAEEGGLAVEEVDAALAVLGSRGLAGFDVTTGRYFHRELPFDLAQVETLQPRLQGARKLLDANRVEMLKRLSNDAADVAVGGTGTTHHVRLRPDGDRCTCPWFSKHQGQRGPCKHILAARMLAGGGQDTPDEDT